MKNYFSRKLKEIINERELTQSVLAKRIDMTQSQVSNWINGRSLPGYFALSSLSTRLGVSVDFFFEEA